MGLGPPKGCSKAIFGRDQRFKRYFGPLGLPLGVFLVRTGLKLSKGCSRAILGRDQRFKRNFGPLGLP